jgi:DNA invertase Pin-like site-specific DNA recombinase
MKPAGRVRCNGMARFLEAGVAWSRVTPSRLWHSGNSAGQLCSIIMDAQLHAAGCAKVYSEKVSGARTDRPELAKILRRLEPGDVLMVTRLDRLARSTRDLLNILHMLGERGIGFRSLADAWANTTTAHGRLLVTMLAGIAEFERELIRARTGEGRKRAQARGVKFGRPPKALQRLAAGETQTDIARSYGVSHVTIGRLQGPVLRPFDGVGVPAL